MRNLFVEIYFPKGGTKDRAACLARTEEEIVEFLTPRIDSAQIEPILASLRSQRQNPNLFPNVVLFLDTDGYQTTISEYMENGRH